MSSSHLPVLRPLSPREFLVAANCPRRWALEASRSGGRNPAVHEELQRALACDAAEKPERLRDVVVGDERIRAVLDFLEPDDLARDGQARDDLARDGQAPDGQSVGGESPGGTRLVLCRGALRLKAKLREEARVLSLCARISGRRVSSVVVLLVDKEYRVTDPAYPDADRLFRPAPIGMFSEVELDEVEQRLNTVRSLLESLVDAEPSAYPSCGSPNCSCRRHELPQHNVFTLFLASGTAERFMEQGIHRIVDIPEDAKLGRRQRIQRETLIQNKPHVDRELIREFVGRLQYPVGYLDFEAIASPVPLYSGTTPWQYVPFLFSLHIEASPGEPVHHRTFYCRPELDERAQFAAELDRAIDGLNSLVVFDASLEKRILRSLLSDEYLDQEKLGDSFTERILDLLPLFREFGWYAPEQRGSVSLKAILPLMTDQVGYESLEVADGLSAGVEYLAARRDAIRGLPAAVGNGVWAGGSRARPAGNGVRVVGNRELGKSLVEYCAVDTLGLYYIVKRLRKLAE